MKHALWLLAATAALAGCSGGDEETNAGPQCLDHQFADESGVCVDHVEPHMMVMGLPDSVRQFQSVEFAWSLMPGTRGTPEQPVHSMDSRILASTSNDPVDNTTGPDAWGAEVAKQQHKNFPDNFTAAFSWEEVGMVYLKGYMLIDGQNVWQDLQTVDVSQVVATGNRTEVAISFPPPEIASSEVGITVGDGVIIANDANNPVDYTVTLEGVSCPTTSATLGSMGGTLELDFVTLGRCDITLNTPLSATGQDPGQLDLSVNASAP